MCNHKVQVGVLADAEHWEQDVRGTILATDDQAGLLKARLETCLIGDDVLHVWHAVVATNGVRYVLVGHSMVAIRVHHV